MSRVIIIYSVIIFAGVILFFVGSRYAFQKACKRRASHPANLETADDEQNSLSTKNEKIRLFIRMCGIENRLKAA